MPQLIDFAGPKLVVRVGVTGHRPPKLDKSNQSAIRNSVRVVLAEILSVTRDIEANSSFAYKHDEPELHVVSSLAEGADRIVAEEGVALRAILQVPLPARRDEYRKDFCSQNSELDSAARFDSLLAQAANVFELDGKRKRDDDEFLPPSAYAAAGHIVAGHCDLLLAIWDGKRGEEGGTAQIVREAIRAGIPVVRIDADTPEIVNFSPEGSDWHGTWRLAWQGALSDTLRNALSVPDYATEWLENYTKGSSKSEPDLNRADHLGIRYSKRYRLSSEVKYWLSACAVLCALAGMESAGAAERNWTLLELAFITGVLLGFLFAWHYKWHERWIHYRMLAEQFRVLEFLKPLGQTVPLFRPPVYWHDPGRHAWIGWYFRARVRETGLPSASVTPEYVRGQRNHLLKQARQQIGYHKRNHKRTHRRHRAAHFLGLFFFICTLLACLAHLLKRSHFLGAATAALPALAAALEGLQAQAEWQRLSERSERMIKHLESIRGRLSKSADHYTLASLSAIAVDLAEAMTSETSEWHNLIYGKPLNLS
jgi:hypothetical protein